MIIRLGLILAILLGASCASAREVTDLAGRKVAVPDRVERIVLTEGRLFPVFGILDRDDPSRRIVGMMGDFKRLDPTGFAIWRDRFPKLDQIPAVGQSTGQTFSAEAAIALAPDVAVMGLGGGHGPSAKEVEIVRQLETAGIAVVFIDFRVDPLVNTPRSIKLLGEVMGRQAEAEAFNAYYAEQLALVDAGLRGLETPPLVFIESRVGLTEGCCETMGAAMLGRFVTRAGGRNMGADLVPGASGDVSVEYLLSHQPDYYLGTAVGSTPAPAGQATARILLGPRVDAAAARASLRKALARPGIADLTAVREHRAMGMWHHFYNSAFNVAALQAVAVWLHPERFPGLDPQATLATMFQRFQPVDLGGAYWIADKP